MTGTAASNASAPPGFDDSVFISYSHADNAPFGIELGHGERRWVTFMSEELARRLRQVSGDETSVWRDPKLQGNDVFADELEDRLAQCAVLVSVCSPRYLNSEWCQRELEAFVEAASSTGGLELGTKSRVFKVVKTPIERDEQPPPLEPLLGYEFYGVEPDGGIREFLLMPQPDGLVLFFQRLDDLVQDIARLLAEMEGNEDTEPTATAVFLADSTSDVSQYRDDLKRELERRGHAISPSREMPLVAEQLSQAVRDELQSSRLSIHILGSRYGPRPEGDDRSIPHIELDLAGEVAATGALTQLIWLPDAPGPRENAQQVVIDRLDDTVGDDIEVIRGPLESFKSYLLDKVSESLSTGSDVTPDATAHRVYLVHDPADREPAVVLRDRLEKRGLKVMTPLFEGSEAEVRDLHRESMVLSDAVLIYYGQTSEAWARTKLNDLIKAKGWGRTKPFLATAMVLGPPGTESKAAFHTTEALVIDAIEHSDASLAPFLDQLARSGEAR